MALFPHVSFKLKCYVTVYIVYEVIKIVIYEISYFGTVYFKKTQAKNRFFS